jgi:POT family proton-dependent oligopeptide transporter
LPGLLYVLCLSLAFELALIDSLDSSFVNRPLPTEASGGNPRTGAGGPGDQGISGALGQGTKIANAINTFNTFWIYVVPLFGAYIADTRWGRYKTVCVAIGVAILGHIFLIIAAVPPVIVETSAAFGVFVLGVVVVGVGAGMFKPNISPLIVEQINIQSLYVKELESGERVIVDPTITQSRIYHYYYLFVNLGALAGQLGMSFASKYVGFWLSFLLPTALFCVTPLVMWWGRNKYKQAPPQGSVLSKSLKLLWRATTGRWSINPLRTWKNMHDGTFWNNVKPSNVPVDQRPAWYTFDDQWVDEVRRGFAACAVFGWYPLYWITYNQINNNLTAQATTMQLNGLPPEVLNNMNPISLIIFIPICDSFIYPALRKAHIRFTPIKKIYLGFMLGTAAMIWAAVLQHYIYQKNPCGDHANTCIDEEGNNLFSPINVWAQTGAYVLIGFSEIFASITSLEYAYSKAPRNMRSIVQAMALFMTALSAAIGQALIELSEDPLLVWNYAVMAILAFIAGTIFWFQFRGLDKQEDELNFLPEGHVVVNRDVEDRMSSDVATQQPLEKDVKV